MKENQFGYEYSWSDLQPVRALSIAVAAAQVVGAGLSVLAAPYPSWTANLWFGGAVASFPGYLIGLVVQRHLKPMSLTENRVLVRRIGFIAAVLSLGAFILPLGTFHAA